MRRLRPDPVPRALLVQLVEAATWGPYAGGAHQDGYVIVTDRQQKARLAVLWRKVVDPHMPVAARSRSATQEPEAWARGAAAVQYRAEHFAETPALIIACYGTHPPSPPEWAAFWRGLRHLRWRDRWQAARH